MTWLRRGKDWRSFRLSILCWIWFSLWIISKIEICSIRLSILIRSISPGIWKLWCRSRYGQRTPMPIKSNRPRCLGMRIRKATLHRSLWLQIVMISPLIRWQRGISEFLSMSWLKESNRILKAKLGRLTGRGKCRRRLCSWCRNCWSKIRRRDWSFR